MSYAIRKDGTSWRAVGGPGDIGSDEIYSETQPPVPAPDPLAKYVESIQQRLDAFARTRNYDGILSAATYATSAVAKFKAEGQYAVAARDATWAKGYEILAAVQAGTRPASTLDELASELPALEWPQ